MNFSSFDPFGITRMTPAQDPEQREIGKPIGKDLHGPKSGCSVLWPMFDKIYRKTDPGGISTCLSNHFASFLPNLKPNGAIFRWINFFSKSRSAYIFFKNSKTKLLPTGGGPPPAFSPRRGLGLFDGQTSPAINLQVPYVHVWCIKKSWAGKIGWHGEFQNTNKYFGCLRMHTGRPL